jgi:excisionase family DNA binding protein
MEVINKKFLTIGETQSYLGSSRGFVYTRIDKGELTPLKVGRRTYFKTQEVENLFKEKGKSNCTGRGPKVEPIEEAHGESQLSMWQDVMCMFSEGTIPYIEELMRDFTITRKQP